MKLELIVAAVLTSVSICERQQRSTVLTDESKRVVEHYDFASFDKQEALNYLDRQRYENLIRGKRSHYKFNKDQKKKSNGRAEDVCDKYQGLPNDSKSNQSLKPNLKLQRLEMKNFVSQIENRLHYSGSVDNTCGGKGTPFDFHNNLRNKRRHHYKKKHNPNRVPCESNNYTYDESEDEESRYWKRKRKRNRRRHYWDRWSEWSPCSVTCGRGRKIRWRRCIAQNCTIGEFEMGEKTCQLPACNLITKLLGL